MNLIRRHFNRLAITSAATSLIPGASARFTERRLRFAIVGLGRISGNCFMSAIKASSISEITALVSGTPEKTRRLASQYGVRESSIYLYEQFASIRENARIDAVCIGLPNGMHAEYTIRAARAGKHILCEKPMATSVEEARAMIASCEANHSRELAQQLFEPIKQEIRAGMLQRNVPSIAAAKDGKILREEGLGWADREHRMVAGAFREPPWCASLARVAPR